jgi:hypothetical protein
MWMFGNTTDKLLGLAGLGGVAFSTTGKFDLDADGRLARGDGSLNILQRAGYGSNQFLTVKDDEATPTTYIQGRTRPENTLTPEAGIDDFGPEIRLDGGMRITMPKSTNTPSADELPKWSWVNSQMQAGVTVVYTPVAAVSIRVNALEAVASVAIPVLTHDVMRSAADPTTLLAAKYGEIVQNAAGTTVLIAVGVPTYSWLQLKP